MRNARTAVSIGVRSRTMKLILKPALVLLLIAQVGQAWAHHSFALFDPTQCREITGTVHALEWKFPHSWLWVTVPDGQSGAGTWGFEGDSPQLLGTKGWKRDSLKRGDKVTVRYVPLRDGRQGGAFGLVLLPDGSSLQGSLNARVCWPQQPGAQP